MYLGETIALIVAVAWTVTAMFAEIGSKRIGSLSVNIIRMALSLILLGILLWVTTGSPYPTLTDWKTWMWLALSGLVGYVFGDWCLFNSYILIGSRFGQLLMTLSSVFAALAGYLFLAEKLRWISIIGMTVTLFGIGLSVMGKKEGSDHQQHIGLKLPFKGILLGIGAAMGQGIGLVLSKMGLNSYSASIAGADETIATMAPFAGTFIRAVFGLTGFLVMMLIQGKSKELKAATHDGKGLGATFMATLFGPFIGVSLSLMAVQYTATGIAQTIMALTPVLILLPAHIFFKQRISAREILGAVISVAGVSLFFL